MRISPDWATTELGEVLDFVGNGTTAEQNKDGAGLPVTRIETISNDYVDANRVGFIANANDELVGRYRIAPGDVLFSHINSEPQIGRAVVYDGIPPTLIHGMNLLRLRFKTDIADPRFMVFLFRQFREAGVFVGLASRAVGQSSINQGRLKALQVPVPPIAEQRAIAHVLQTVQKAKEARQRELALERERKAAQREYLYSHGTKAAATKRIETFEVPEGWTVEPLGSFCEFLQYGTSERCEADEGNASPVLGIPNVVTGQVDLRKVKYLKADEALKAKLTLLRGDVVFVRTNATRANTGKCAVFRDEATDVLFASYLIRARLKAESLLPDFVREFTETFLGKSQLSGRASNAADGKFNINTQTIRSVLIPRPSWEEQGEIAAILNACDAKLRALERELSVLEQLFNAVLEQLLSGEVSVAHLAEEYAQ